MMVSTSSISLLLVLATAAAVSAAESTKTKNPMFVDWISQQASSKIKTAEYDDLETEDVCLMQTKLRNCRCLNSVENAQDEELCQRAYEETTMSCCERHHSPGSFMSESSLMGVCSWTSDYFDKPVKYDGTTTEKIGIFTVKCEMREDSDKCGSPLCEGMSLDGSGDILVYPKVAFGGDSAIEKIATESSCSDFNITDPYASKRIAPPRNARSPVAKTEAKIQYAYDDNDYKFYIGKGEIFTGTFRVTSRFHASKFKTGQIQVAFPLKVEDLPTDPVKEVPDKAYVAIAHQVNLEFFKDSQGY